VRRLLLWGLLGAVLIALVLIVARRGEDASALSGADLGSLAQKIVVLVIAGAVALMLFRERFAQALTAALFWVALALILVVGYSYRFELHDVAERVMAELAPGHAATTTAGRTVQVARAANGDFAVTTQINGARVSMVLDTGASSVVLTREDAKAAGLPLEVLNYSVSIDTANGRTQAAPVTLDRVAIGGLTEHSIAALVAQPGQLKVSLLGMSFLNRMQSWEVRGDRLLLHAYP
jgi:aspartyl protease family protein